MKNTTKTMQLVVHILVSPFVLLSFFYLGSCANSNVYGSETCGDGIIDEGEECDDGNKENNDGCNFSCQYELFPDCGNGTLDINEECDDGNIANGDGCNVICKIELYPNCGDGVVDSDEECDDSNTQSGDGCSSTCQNEFYPDCGNGTVDLDEECDDSNTQDGDGCSSTCEIEFYPNCGNGLLDSDEECDDSNTENGDGCSSACLIEIIPVCGDGILNVDEECDDGNNDNSDSCPDGDGGTCLNAICGDGFTQTSVEECDDGNVGSGDGCTSGCVLEFCGDGIIQGALNEVCETGSNSCTTSCGTTGVENCENCDWGSCIPPSETCNGNDDNCDSIIDMTSCLATVSRFYNSTTDDHMYKTNQNPEPGYVMEYGSHFKVYINEVPGTIPIYQLFNGTDHMISLGPNEAAATYTQSELFGYVGSSSWFSAGFAPTQMCRYYNPNTGDHMIFGYLNDTDLPNVLPYRIRESCVYYAYDFYYPNY
jgi:cysteine-rich repeat protein